MNTFKVGKFLSIIFIFISSLAYSQKYLDVIIVKNNNDTIKSKMKVYTNIFSKKLIEESSFYKRIILVDENGKKIEKIRAINVKELKFKDFKGYNNTYVNGGKALRKLAFNGKKIKWYRDIRQHPLDGSIIYVDYLIDNKGKKYSIGLFNNKKKKLIEATKSKPELLNEIENTKMRDDNILKILIKFDEN